MELDYLEKNVLKAIEESSVYNFQEIEHVYQKCNSFDDTVSILKLALSEKISTDYAFKILKNLGKLKIS